MTSMTTASFGTEKASAAAGNEMTEDLTALENPARPSSAMIVFWCLPVP